MLIIDDNSTNRRILNKQSLLWGMIPSAAPSAIEALDFIRHGHAFDVCILDMNMSSMDSLDLAGEIRKCRDAKALPLIMLRSLAQRSRDTAMNGLAPAAFLNKPIKASALFDALLRSMQIVPPPIQIQRPPQPTCKLADSLPLKILIAEDNTINQKVLQQLLAHLGYRADAVANGLEALDAVERQNYDVVLMDVQMPIMDGQEATRRLRSRFGREALPRVIAMTANAMPGDREECFAAGMDAYVPKPVSLEDIRAVLTAVAAPPNKDRPAEDDAVLDQRRIRQLIEVQDESNPTLLANLIDLFLDDTPKRLKDIETAVANKDSEQLESSAHRLLSSIENLGVQRMRHPCIELERLARTRSLDGAAALFDDLQRHFITARQHLQASATSRRLAG
jgi:CheY-like chemotaxis protein/HPt (histidine-containing phosphotransfer) domain-containing protein